MTSKFVELLPENYGYVILTTVGSTFVNMWMAINVGRARKQYEVEYPDMYHPTNKMFNCIQRAHQNTLENHPTFILLTIVGGLQYPRLTAVVGFSYLVSRVLYAKGYYSGEPSNRRWGAFGHISMLLLLGHTISLCAHQLNLEEQPTFVILTLLGGLQYPRLTSVIGCVYLVSRVIYANGYYTGDPDNRKVGALLSHVSMLLLLGHTLSFAFHQLKWVPHAGNWMHHRC